MMPSESCCCPTKEGESVGAACPKCGEKGRLVDCLTVKALLRCEALARHASSEYRFCETGGCTIVYYGESDSFERKDVSVPVFQKESPGQRTVCYCFDIKESDIRGEIEETGESTADRRIISLVQAKRCACEIRNPQGSCCLGNLARVKKNLMSCSSDQQARSSRS